MTSITINGAEQAIRAGTWAEKNLKSQWTLEYADVLTSRPSYRFTFSDTHDASWFALKWKQ